MGLFEKIKEKNKIKKQQRIIAKEREHYHKEVLAQERLRKNDPRVAPKDFFISFRNINKIYDNHVQAVYDFNLDIKEKEFIVLVGPSGCGKSTTLRMLAGLEDITSGDLYIDGNYANELSPKDRGIAMVFQSYALYPHMTVYQNMAFGLQINHVPEAEIKEKVYKAAEILQLTDYLDRKPSALSGGQCQRVALGRAIVRDSKLFLMDEPLSNLDAKLRVAMRAEIVKLHESLNATTIYVTHDQTEAMTMATRIVVMSKGYIQQIGTPAEIYQNPANLFVATFIGSPAMNIYEVKYAKGFATLPNGYKVNIGESFTKTIQKFYKKQAELYLDKINVLKDRFFNRNLENLIDVQAYQDLETALNDVKVDLTKNGYPEETINELSSCMSLEDLNTKYQEIVKEFLFNKNLEENIEIQELVNTFNTLSEQVNKTEFNLKLGIRPENITCSRQVINDEELQLEVSVAELLGSEYFLHFDLAKDDLVAKIDALTPISPKEKMHIYIDPKRVHFFDLITTNSIK